MSALLLALLRRQNLFMAPVGADGEVSGGAGGGDDLGDEDPEDDGEADGGQDTPDDDGEDADDDGDGSDEDGADDEAGDAGDEGGNVISLGEPVESTEDEDHRAPNWVRDLRKSNREKDRAIRERDAEIARLKGGQQQTRVEVGAEPDIDAYEDEFGTLTAEAKARFKADHAAWVTRKGEADKLQREQQQAQEASQREWETRLKAVDTAGAALKQKDHDEAVEALGDVFNELQMGMLIDAASDATKAAQLRYALGKSPTEAARLAAIKHPVKFIAEIARLEAKLKVTPRKPATTPESNVRSQGGGAKASAVENSLERAREQARKTGDYSKVMELKREQTARAERAKKRA
jgi:hypothetical protein